MHISSLFLVVETMKVQVYVARGGGKVGCLSGKMMAPPIHLGAWSVVPTLWLPLEYY